MKFYNFDPVFVVAFFFETNTSTLLIFDKEHTSSLLNSVPYVIEQNCYKILSNEMRDQLTLV